MPVPNRAACMLGVGNVSQCLSDSEKGNIGCCYVPSPQCQGCTGIASEGGKEGFKTAPLSPKFQIRAYIHPTSTVSYLLMLILYTQEKLMYIYFLTL